MAGFRPPPVWKAAEEAIVAGDVVKLDALLRDDRDVFRTERPQSWWNNTLTPTISAGDARTIIASTHQFDSWDHFLVHQTSMRDADIRNRAL